MVLVIILFCLGEFIFACCCIHDSIIKHKLYDLVKDSCKDCLEDLGGDLCECDSQESNCD